MKAKEAELRKRLGELAVELRSHHTEHEKNWTAEAEARFNALNTEIDTVTAAIEREVRMERAEAAAGETNAAHRPPLDGTLPAPASSAGRAFRDYLLGKVNLGQEGYTFRALQADDDIHGGYLVTPEQVVADLIKSIDNLTFMRQNATVRQVVNAAALGAPSLDADPADADWTGEITAVSNDTTMALGKRQLHPHSLSKLVKVSNPLLRLTGGGAEQLVMERLAYKFAVTQEQAFLTGTGALQPMGVFTASAQGIPTTRDVSTGNTTTAITVDGLIEALYSLKEGYQRNARWIFSRTAVKNIRKLKDGDGQYLWQTSAAGGQPATILDKPFHMSEYAPSTFTTGLYVGIVGDFSYYWIADSLELNVQRLNELYAATNQVGFIGRMESDGMPVLAEAFARVTLA